METKLTVCRNYIYQLVGDNDGSPTKLKRFYDYVQLIAIVLSIIPLAFREYIPNFATIEYYCVGLFILDYIFRWIVADKKLRKGWLSFVIYPFTLMAIIDMLSILPSFNILSGSFHLFRITRLFKILRIFKFGRYSNELMILVKVLKEQRSVLLSVLTLAIFYIIVTALLMFNVDEQFEDFFDALYWATSALTTVGYGDIYPHNDIGRVISMISSLVGVAIIALPSGVITASYLKTIEENKKNK